MKLIESLAAIRTDGWENFLTGLGQALRDKRTATTFVPNASLTVPFLDEFFSGSSMARRIVKTYPQEALRQGFGLTHEDPAQVKRVATELARHGVLGKIEQAAIWGRLHGGCGLLLGYGGGSESPPVGAPQYYQIVERPRIEIESWEKSIASVRFGQPATYRLAPHARTGEAGAIVHADRFVIFPGDLTTPAKKEQLAGWDQSVLDPLWADIRDFEVAWSSILYMLQDAGQSVFKIKDLALLIAAKGDESFKKRIQLIEVARSSIGALLLDKDEEWERKVTTFTGLADMLDRAANKLASATEIPVTFLMGVSPAGLNATGASDIRSFYDRVQSYRTIRLEPLVRATIDPLIAGLGIDPAAVSLTWPSLWQESPAEYEQRRKSVADRDAIYITNQVLTPEEVARARFPEGGWSAETTIDTPLRDTDADATDDEARELVTDKPEEPATTAGAGLEFAPTDVAKFATLNEARASKGLPPWSIADEGKMILSQFVAMIEARAVEVGTAEGTKEAKEIDPDAAKKEPPAGFPPAPGGNGAPLPPSPPPPALPDSE